MVELRLVRPAYEYRHHYRYPHRHHGNALLLSRSGSFHDTFLDRSVVIDQAEDSTVAWYTHLPPARPDGNPKLWKPEQQFQANVPVGYFAMIFLLLASFNHLWVSTIGWNTYLQNLSLGRNPVRWFEYGFSASLMHVHVAMLAGTMDLHLCFLIFGLTMSTMAFGYLTEPTEKGGEPLPRAFWLGFVPYVYQWLVIYCYFFTAVSRGNPPGFVWAIIIIILILDLAFAVNMYLNLYRINKWSSFLYTEIAYCVLSLTSKQLLAWLNYGGN